MEGKEKLLKSLGEHIRNLRTKKGITQTQLAHNIGRDSQSIQRLEAGKANPTFSYLSEVAEGLEIAIGELVSFKKP